MLSNVALSRVREFLGLDDNEQLPSHVEGYPVVYYTKDGRGVCTACANREIDQAQAVVDVAIYYEGPPFTCEDCEKIVIESAYDDPDPA